jgi:hypothetical protein
VDRTSAISCGSMMKEKDCHDYSTRIFQSIRGKLEKNDSKRLSKVFDAALEHSWLYQEHAQLKAFTASRIFQGTCAAFILLNTLFVGYDTEVSMANAMQVPPAADQDWIQQANRAFAMIFGLECAIRIIAHRLLYVFGPEWKWNLFDAALVLVSIVEEVLLHAVSLDSLSMLRVFRLTKIFRVIRVMRFFRDLRLMMSSILSSLIALCWALALLGLIMLMFSIVFMQSCITHLRFSGADAAVRRGIEEWFSTLPISMCTLLQAITNGIDWGKIWTFFHEMDEHLYAYLFVGYVTFVVIGIMNVLTGIFVERAVELGGVDRALAIQAEIKRSEAFTTDMKRIFEEVDEDKSGTISWSEFKEYLGNEEVRAYLAAQQLDPFDARQLFDIVNEQNEEEIGLEQFIASCMRLRGQAKSVDVVTILREQKLLTVKMKKWSTQMLEEVADVKEFVTTGVIKPKQSRRGSQQSLQILEYDQSPPGAARRSIT